MSDRLPLLYYIVMYIGIAIAYSLTLFYCLKHIHKSTYVQQEITTKAMKYHNIFNINIILNRENGFFKKKLTIENKISILESTVKGIEKRGSKRVVYLLHKLKYNRHGF